MCYLLLELLWFYLTQQGDMCVYNNFSIYTFLYFFLYSSVSVSNWTWILTDVQLQLIIIWIISASFLCLFVKSTRIMKNVVPRSVTNLLNCSVLRHMYGNIRIVNPYVHGTEKAMAPHSSTLAWKVPWKEELDELQSMGSLGVRYDWETSLSLFTFMHWRRRWQPTPMSLPGESQGQGSLVGCRLWGCTESSTTEVT